MGIIVVAAAMKVSLMSPLHGPQGARMVLIGAPGTAVGILEMAKLVVVRRQRMSPQPHHL